MELKWVEDSPGKYKLVNSDDPRPEVKLQSRNGAPTIQYVPSWKKYEMPMFVGNAQEQDKASTKFAEEREHAIKTEKKAARWEKSRRDWLQSQKHEWRTKELAKLKEAGR